MARIYNSLFLGMWLVWAAYWWGLSGRAKATERRESLFSRLSYMVPLLLAGVLRPDSLCDLNRFDRNLAAANPGQRA
jgi:hypothetical protein